MSPFSKLDDIIKSLKTKPYFTKADIEKCYVDSNIDISNDALNVKIHRWKKKGIIHNVAKGKYVINSKSVIVPQADEIIREIYNLFISKYDNVDYCIWSTNWLTNYMHHIPFNYFYVIETEKDIYESVFYLLKDSGVNVYNNPDTEQIEKYVLPEKNSVIIRKLVSRSPYQKVDGIRFASIEKVLVDIFCDQDIFYLYSGREQDWIFENILNAYNVNFSTMLTYAGRRKREKELRAYLIKNFDDSVKEIIE